MSMSTTTPVNSTCCGNLHARYRPVDVTARAKAIAAGSVSATQPVSSSAESSGATNTKALSPLLAAAQVGNHLLVNKVFR